MEYDFWACIDGSDPIRITVVTSTDGVFGAKECIETAGLVWESLASCGAAMCNAHPMTGQTAEQWRALQTFREVERGN